MLIKIIGSVIIVTACTFVGVELSKELMGRVKVLEEWLHALMQIQNYICYTKMPLADIYEQLEKSEGEVSGFFARVRQNLDLERSTGALWKLELEGVHYLSKEDKEILSQLSETLGQSDSESQVSQIELTQNRLVQNLCDAKERAKRDAKMYRALSFFTGVGIAILLI